MLRDLIHVEVSECYEVHFVLCNARFNRISEWKLAVMDCRQTEWVTVICKLFALRSVQQSGS